MTSSSSTVLLVTSIFVGWCGAGNVLEIIEMHVPLVVENGSNSSVVLDCDYALRQPDKSSELVVQWYFGTQPRPVYQWIPGKPPQDLGLLKGRLNLRHRASDDPLKWHRALEIVRPSVELSGDYRCKVATVEDEAHATRSMIVYAPARSLEIWHQQVDADSVNVMCRAEGVAPRPRLQLLRYNADVGVEVEGPATLVTPTPAAAAPGLYDATLRRSIADRSLHDETIFECVLSIPHTQYQVRRRSIYYPERASSISRSSGSPSLSLSSAWLLLSLCRFLC